jgi:hypothetical protein
MDFREKERDISEEEEEDEEEEESENEDALRNLVAKDHARPPGDSFGRGELEPDVVVEEFDVLGLKDDEDALKRAAEGAGGADLEVSLVLMGTAILFMSSSILRIFLRDVAGLTPPSGGVGRGFVDLLL